MGIRGDFWPKDNKNSALWDADRPESNSEPLVWASEQSLSLGLPGAQTPRSGRENKMAQSGRGSQASRVTEATVVRLCGRRREGEENKGAVGQHASPTGWLSGSPSIF